MKPGCFHLLLLHQTAVPIIVVTIPTLSAYGAGSWSIETDAASLYDRWGIGHRSLRDSSGRVRPWKRGVLFLVSVGDRRVRIELGAGYGHAYDAKAREILDRHVLPYFREGRYERGILEGVEAPGRMVRVPLWLQVGTFTAGCMPPGTDGQPGALLAG